MISFDLLKPLSLWAMAIDVEAVEAGGLRGLARRAAETGDALLTRFGVHSVRLEDAQHCQKKEEEGEGEAIEESH